MELLGLATTTYLAFCPDSNSSDDHGNVNFVRSSGWRAKPSSCMETNHSCNSSSYTYVSAAIVTFPNLSKRDTGCIEWREHFEEFRFGTQIIVEFRRREAA